MRGSKRFDLITIGASTGGPNAITTLLGALPMDFPVGIAYVQHIETNFGNRYAGWLDLQISLKARLAQSSDFPLPGEVLVPPAGYHLKVQRADRMILNDGPPVKNQKPSVDMLFTSAAEALRDRVIAVIMTGMGDDGADGCLAVKEAGGITIAQDRDSSVVYGMARVAVQKNAIMEILPLEEISSYLGTLVGG